MHKAVDAEGGEARLYCYSEARAKKERGIANRFAARFEGELKKLHDGLSRPRTHKRLDRVWQRIGRIREKSRGAGAHYDIDVIADESGEKARAVTWKRRPLAGTMITHPGVYWWPTSCAARPTPSSSFRISHRGSHARPARWKVAYRRRRGSPGMPPDEPAGRPPSEAASPESPPSPLPRRARVPASGLPDGHAPGADSEGKTLTIPRSISYSGRIGSCERLMVEGTVETEIHGCRVLTVAASGVFRGTADVERADISGTVEGPLTVRELLTVRASARILSGSISYGELETERGGTVTGTVLPLLEVAE